MLRDEGDDRLPTLTVTSQGAEKRVSFAHGKSLRDILDAGERIAYLRETADIISLADCLDFEDIFLEHLYLRKAQ